MDLTLTLALSEPATLAVCVTIIAVAAVWFWTLPEEDK